MNKTFDIKRMGMVIRWNFQTRWLYYLGGVIGCIVAFSLFSFIMQYSNNTLLRTCSVEIAQNNYFSQEVAFFGFMSFVAINVMATCIFSNMRTKNDRESFLMLPASNLEKYVACLLMMGIGSIIELFIILFATDVIQLVFSYIVNMGFHASITAPVLRTLFDNFMFTHLGAGELLFISFLIFVHSFCTLGGTFYRKMAPFLVAITATVLFMLAGNIIHWLVRYREIILNIGYGNSVTATIVSAIVFLALSAFNYWASYKLFTRMQVICNKWINI